MLKCINELKEALTLEYAHITTRQMAISYDNFDFEQHVSYLKMVKCLSSSRYNYVNILLFYMLIILIFHT